MSPQTMIEAERARANRTKLIISGVGRGMWLKPPDKCQRQRIVCADIHELHVNLKKIVCTLDNTKGMHS